MSRLLLSAAALALWMPAAAVAEKKPAADARKQHANVLPIGSYGESKPSQCKQCGATSNQDVIYPPWMSHRSLGHHAHGYGAFGDELRAQFLQLLERARALYQSRTGTAP